jgi:hypothetical protein
MLVSKVVSEQVNEPFPRRGNCGLLNYWEVILEEFLFNNSALFVAASAKGKTDFIRRFVIDQCLNDERTGIVDKGFASWFDEAIKQLTKLFVYKISHSNFVISSIVLHNS